MKFGSYSNGNSSLNVKIYSKWQMDVDQTPSGRNFFGNLILAFFVFAFGGTSLLGGFSLTHQNQG